MGRDDLGWILVALVCIGLETWLSLSEPRLRLVAVTLMGFWPPLLQGIPPVFGWQPLTMFLTYGFLHTGPGHLMGNMVALGLFGRTVARRIGGAGWFLYFYVLFLLGGAAGFLLLSDRAQPVVGASGAIMGLYGLWLIWDWRVTRQTGRTLLYLAAAAAADQALRLLTGGQVAWETHLGGLLSGAAAGLLLPPFDERRGTRDGGA